MPYVKHVWHDDDYLTVSQLNEMSEAIENASSDLNTKQDIIDSSNKVSIDYISTGSTNKLLTIAEYNTINSTLSGKQNAISGLNKLNADYISNGSTNKILTKTEYNNLNSNINNNTSRINNLEIGLDTLEEQISSGAIGEIPQIKENVTNLLQQNSTKDDILDELLAEVGLGDLETTTYPTTDSHVRLSQKVTTNTTLIDQILEELGLTDLNDDEYPTSTSHTTIKQLITALSQDITDQELVILDFSSTITMTDELYLKLIDRNRKIRIVYDNGSVYSDIIKLVRTVDSSGEEDVTTYTGYTLDNNISIIFTESTITLHDSRPVKS